MWFRYLIASLLALPVLALWLSTLIGAGLLHLILDVIPRNWKRLWLMRVNTKERSNVETKSPDNWQKRSKRDRRDSLEVGLNLLLSLLVVLLLLTLSACTTTLPVKQPCPKPPGSLLVRPAPLVTITSPVQSPKTTTRATPVVTSSTP